MEWIKGALDDNPIRLSLLDELHNQWDIMREEDVRREKPYDDSKILEGWNRVEEVRQNRIWRQEQQSEIQRYRQIEQSKEKESEE